MDYRLIYVTMPDDRSARQMAKSIVIERLAACANLIPGADSFYWWEGVVQEEKESVVMFKTTEDKQTDLIDRIRALHPYDTPCIICLPINDGYGPFLEWIDQEVHKARTVIDDIESFPEEEV